MLCYIKYLEYYGLDCIHRSTYYFPCRRKKYTIQNFNFFFLIQNIANEHVLNIWTSFKFAETTQKLFSQN